MESVSLYVTSCNLDPLFESFSVVFNPLTKIKGVRDSQTMRFRSTPNTALPFAIFFIVEGFKYESSLLPVKYLIGLFRKASKRKH